MFLILQDLCQLVNADQPFWLIGMTEMTRTFGLELLEAVLTAFPEIFQSVRIIIVIILWISVVLFCIYFIQIISYI